MAAARLALAPQTLCACVALFLHGLYLVMVFFMLAEACELLLATVLIVHVHTARERAAMVIAAWGTPSRLRFYILATSDMTPA